MAEPTAPTSLTVWIYDSAPGAAAGEVRLKDLAEHGGARILDAITVTWMPGAEAPLLGHLRHQTVGAATKGSLIGALIGALLLAPAVGAGVGAGAAALAQRLRDTGIDQALLDQVRERLVPGTSALVILSSDHDLGAVGSMLERGRERGDVHLLHAALSAEAPAALQALLRDLEAR